MASSKEADQAILKQVSQPRDLNICMVELIKEVKNCLHNRQLIVMTIDSRNATINSRDENS